MSSTASANRSRDFESPPRAQGIGGLFAGASMVALLGICSHATATTVFHVTSTADTSGNTCTATCTLRQAINAANASGADAVEIDFDIGSGGISTIQPTAALPFITRDSVTINGYSQGGHANTLADGDDADIRVILLANLLPPPTSALVACGSGTTIKGLSIIGAPGAGIAIGNGGCPGNATPGAAVTGNFIGVEIDGHNAFANATGISVDGTGSSATIGGAAAADRNVISNNHIGIELLDLDTANILILGNYIGTDSSGLNPGQNDTGIDAERIVGASIGSTTAPNRIVATGSDIVVRGPQTPGGSEATGVSAAANEFFSGNLVPIDLTATTTADGETDNDSNDADNGGNHLQNFPVLSSTTLSYGQVAISGTLDIPRFDLTIGGTRTYTIVAYASAGCHSSGHGPGELFLGGQVIDLTDNLLTHKEHFDLTFAGAPLGTAITATATDDATHDMSEFSACTTLTIGDGIFKDSFEIP